MLPRLPALPESFQGLDPPITSRDCPGPLRERIQWVEPRMGHSTAGPTTWWVLCLHLGAAGKPARPPGPCGNDHSFILGKMRKLRLTQGSDLF